MLQIPSLTSPRDSGLVLTAAAVGASAFDRHGRHSPNAPVLGAPVPGAAGARA